MKKLIAAILIFAFAFCITACGKSGDCMPQQAISSSEALPQSSSMPQQASSQNNISWYDKTKSVNPMDIINAQMDYEEFMSQEREFVHPGIVDYDEYLNRHFKFIDGRICLLDAGDNVLKMLDDTYTSGFVSDLKDFCVALVDNHKIIAFDYNAENVTTLYETDMNITFFHMDYNAIYFIADGGLYRYHIKSKTLDLLYTNEKLYYTQPLSNTKFIVDILHDEAYAELKEYGKLLSKNDGMPRADGFIFDSTTGELTEYIYDWDI